MKKMFLCLVLALAMSVPAQAELHYRWVEVDWIPPLLGTDYQNSQNISIGFTVATSHGPVYGSWTGPISSRYAYAIIAIDNGSVHWDPFITIANLPATAIWKYPGGTETVTLRPEYSLKYGQESHGPWVLRYQ